MPQLRDGTAIEDARLDRVVQFDPRSRQFPIRALIGAEQPVTKLWDIPAGSPVLDQGREGACVGCGVTNELRFNPVPVPNLDVKFAREVIYWGAQRIDPWAGGSYPGGSPVYEGTSVLAGIKIATKLGYYTQYRWAFGEADLALAVSHQGPAVLGLQWHQGMYKPNTGGYLRPTGAVIGGHCILCIGIDVERGHYTLYNSWGPTWGQGGTARVRRTDMATMLADSGEACIPLSRFNPTR
jgi:hypothetical protein